MWGSSISVGISDPGASTGNITANMAGEARFAVLVGDGSGSQTQIATLTTQKPRRSYSLTTVSNVIAGGGVLTLLKITEPFVAEHVITVYAVTLPKGTKLSPPQRGTEPIRVDVYGDSDSASFGVDGSSSLSALKCLANMQSYENFLHGWLWGLRTALLQTNQIALDLHVQALDLHFQALDLYVQALDPHVHAIHCIFAHKHL